MVNFFGQFYKYIQVAESEARNFSARKDLNLLRTKNVNSTTGLEPDGWTSINETAPILFTICDLLWKRDAIFAQQGIDV